MMDRLKRIDGFWAWLPVFRVVAETQHLPTASRIFALTPSALSRTIRLLEEDLGQPLFERKNRRLVLNAAGEQLLKAVRDATRLIHEGVLIMEQAQASGPIHFSSPGPFAPIFVLPALEVLAQSHPGLQPTVRAVIGAQANEGLRRGELDLALVDDPVVDPQLHIESLLELTHGVYCAPEHPLAGVEAPDVTDHAFAAPIADESGMTPDQWPLTRPRTIGLRVTQMQVAIDAVKTGRYLAVLPDLVARRQGLVAVDVGPIASTTLFMMHRPLLDPDSKTALAANAVRELARSMAPM